MIILLFIIIWFTLGFTLTLLSPIPLIIVLLIAFIILSHVFYRIDGLLILVLKENENLVNDHKKVGETIRGNRHYIWICLAIASSLCWLLLSYGQLPFILIAKIGEYTELYNWYDWMNNHVTFAIIISVIYSTFVLYLSSFALLVLHLLFFTLEEKLKGNSLINKIETIGKDS